MNPIGVIEASGTKFVVAAAKAGDARMDHTQSDRRLPQENIAEMASWFSEAQKQHGALSAFGIASFGPIVVDRQLANYYGFTPTPKTGWSDVGNREGSMDFGLPLAIDTDVNSAALGEWLAGAGRGERNVAYYGSDLTQVIISRGLGDDGGITGTIKFGRQATKGYFDG